MAEQLLLAERAARVQLERQLADARATIAALQMQLSPVLSDCSDLSTTQKRTLAVKKGVRKKKSKETKVKIPGQSRYWTPEEHKLFLEALRRFGHKDLRSISAYVGTRNMTQVRTHSQKYFMRLMREAKRQNPTATAATTAAANTAAAAAPNSNSATPAGTSTSDADSDPAPQRSGSPNAPPSTDGTSSKAEEKTNNATAPQTGATTTTPAAPAAPAVDPNADKYSVPNTCGMTLLCLVGQDTLTN